MLGNKHSKAHWCKLISTCLAHESMVSWALCQSVAGLTQTMTVTQNWFGITVDLGWVNSYVW